MLGGWDAGTPPLRARRHGRSYPRTTLGRAGAGDTPRDPGVGPVVLGRGSRVRVRGCRWPPRCPGPRASVATGCDDRCGGGGSHVRSQVSCQRPGLDRTGRRRPDPGSGRRQAWDAREAKAQRAGKRNLNLGAGPAPPAAASRPGRSGLIPIPGSIPRPRLQPPGRAPHPRSRDPHPETPGSRGERRSSTWMRELLL